MSDNKNDFNKKEQLILEQYRNVIIARNFHYDNFNRWTTYFYVAIGSVFFAYISLVTAERIYIKWSEFIIVKYGLLFLNFIISFFWFVANKGYYYWNIHWINLVHYYEREILKLDINNRVFNVVSNKKIQNDFLNPIKGANISTSKVTILFSFVVCLISGIMLFYIFFDSKTISNCIPINSPFLNFIFSTFISIFLIYIMLNLSKKYLKGYIKHMHNLKFNLNKKY